MASGALVSSWMTRSSISTSNWSMTRSFSFTRSGEVVVALDERLHGLVDGGFGVAGHQQQFLPQIVQSHLEMIFHKLILKLP